jgi:hypothetical protein
MKITRPLAILALSTLALTSARAQSQLSGDCSCVAMSPRVRQMTEENCPLFPAAGGSDYIQGETVRKDGATGELVMRSPRAEVTDTQDQPRAAIIVDNEANNVGYKPTCHGVTASPKVHQMLKERRNFVEIYETR